MHTLFLSGTIGRLTRMEAPWEGVVASFRDLSSYSMFGLEPVCGHMLFLSNIANGDERRVTFITSLLRLEEVLISHYS